VKPKTYVEFQVRRMTKNGASYSLAGNLKTKAAARRFLEKERSRMLHSQRNRQVGLFKVTIEPMEEDNA